MSIIASGTTTTTALVSTGNTDGTLQLQVNGTTPSVTLNTLGAVGVGSSPSYGTSGQVLVSSGSSSAPTWSSSPTFTTVSDQYGNVRTIPPVGTKTTSYTLTTADVGRYVQLGASGAIVIPDATFSEGNVVSIFNNTASTATITCTITTAYIAGTYTDKAAMTLAAAGVATILFISGTVTGAIYSIMASGLVLTYQTSGVFNFAHAAVAFASAYLYFQLNTGQHIPIVWSLLITVVVFAPLLGLLLGGCFRLLAAGLSFRLPIGSGGLGLLVGSGFSLLIVGLGRRRRLVDGLLLFGGVVVHGVLWLLESQHGVEADREVSAAHGILDGDDQAGHIALPVQGVVADVQGLAQRAEHDLLVGQGARQAQAVQRNALEIRAARVR